LFYYLVSPGNSCRESILGGDGTDADGDGHGDAVGDACDPTPFPPGE